MDSTVQDCLSFGERCANPLVIYRTLEKTDWVSYMNSEDTRHFETDTSLGKVRVRVMDLDNGTLLLLSDSERFRLGISAVAIPPSRDESEPASSGLFSTGLDTILVRTLAERIVSWTGRTCMAVVAINGLNQKVLLELLAFLKDCFLT